MRLVIFGGRKYGHIEPDMKEEELLMALRQEKTFEITMARYAQKNKISVIIHGDATGADALAERYALRNEIPNEKFKADWKSHLRAAGPIRNQEMVDVGKPEKGLAFPGGNGTADMTKRCIAAGVDVIRAFDVPRYTEAPYDSTEDTIAHIQRIRYLLREFSGELFQRGLIHDQSKLGIHEKPLFDQMTPLLDGLTYGSPEYAESLAKLGPALQHHYSNNRHHPEWHTRGVDGMTLADVVEMLMDWKAATERHADGSILRSIEHNKTRFKLSPQLESIFVNTARAYGWK